MNFFERQSESRRASRRLVVLFTLAVLAVIIAVDFVLLTWLATAHNETLTLPSASWIAQHWTATLVISLIVLGIIGFASLYKTVSLSDGGGAVARTLGGVRISPDTKDPKQRRLLNVVEEMAIASGVPMPEVYLLEQELGINAFAAGHSPSNAAVAVTRGTLDTLDRAELQGVIAHEFSHILNGDMRLNIRLMGWVFGLLVIGIIARTILRHAPRSSRSNRKGGAGAIVAVAFVILIIGYVGLFFGRLIQAAVSRSRESLADASAVQFTRDPTGLRNALVKIGAVSSGSRIAHPEGEEVAHMLFAPGVSRLFATHPELKERLRAIDPSFDESEFAHARARLAREAEQRAEQTKVETPAVERLQDVISVPVLTPTAIATLVGNPGTVHIDAAQRIRQSLPATLVSASQQPARAQALLFALALLDDAQGRERQLKYLGAQIGAELVSDIETLLPTMDALDPLQRMPVLMRALPTLRQLTRAERSKLIATLNGLIQREGRLSLSAYALRKLAQVHLHDELGPRARARELTIQNVVPEVALLFSLLAREGHEQHAAAAAAFSSGMSELGLNDVRLDVPTGWPTKLDAALQRLDVLQPQAKEQLIRAMVVTITHDRTLDVCEAELLRAVCACLHCPLPPLVA